MEKALKTKGILLLLLSAIAWGPTYLFIKIAVHEFPPPTLAFLRVAIGWLILYPICRIQKSDSFDWKNRWKQYVILGITFNVLPFYLVSFGELYISSSLAGILYSFTLIFTAILGHFFGMHDPLTKNKILGIALGFVGLATIYLPLVLQENIKSGIGALMVIIACLSTSVGSVYARTHLQKASGLMLLTAQFGVTAVILLPLALFIDHPFSLPIPSFTSIIGIVGLGVICTAGAFLMYYKVIQLAGATYASFTALLIPIFAMILGYFILHEQLTWNLYVGTFFILSGILAVKPTFNKKP
jgi:drug/metabolite transporter (DMT)-like permease